MIQAKSADGVIHQFPDGTSQEVVNKAMKNYAMKKSGASSQMVDIAKSGGVGVGEGVISTLGMFGDAAQMSGDLMGGAAKSAGLPEWAQKGAATAGHMLLGPLGNMPTSAQIKGATEDVTGKFYEPQTNAGQYANTIGQFLPAAALGPGGIARKAVAATAAAVGSEGAGQLAHKVAPQLEPYARLGGALAGGFGPALARRAITPLPISPERQHMVDTMRNEGVDLTAGQTSGRKGLQYMESEMGGGSAANMMDRQGEQFTHAALRRAGIDANRASPEVMDQAFNRIGQQFDSLAARNNLAADPHLAHEIVAGVQQYSNLVPASSRAPIVGNLATDVVNSAQQGMSGAQYQAFRSRISKMARDAADPQLREVLNGLQRSLDDAMERTLAARNSPDLGAWRDVRNQYRNILVLEKAASGAAPSTAEGILTPAQLRSATVQKQGMRNYVRGQGDFADMARAGQGLMTPLPNSGSAARFAARSAGVGLPGIVGALLGHGAGGYPGSAAGMAAGAAVGAAVPYALGKALMSAPVQAYLKNQTAATFGNLTPAHRAMVSALGATASISNKQDQLGSGVR